MPPTTIHFSVIPSSRLALAGDFPSHAKFNGAPKKSVIEVNNVLVQYLTNTKISAKIAHDENITKI